MNDLVEGQFSWSKVIYLHVHEMPEMQITPWVKRNADKHDKSGNTLLHYALWKECQVVVGQLVAMGTNIYAKTHRDGQNVLHLAARYNLPACLSLFLHIGRFNVNRRNANGNTPLHLAAEDMRRSGTPYECMHILLQHGADLNLLNGSNQTVLDILVLPMKISSGVSHGLLDDLIRQGARFHRTKHAEKKYPRLIHLRRSLARFRLASRATALALRHRKDVHKDVIPLIIQQIELTRDFFC